MTAKVVAVTVRIARDITTARLSAGEEVFAAAFSVEVVASVEEM